MRTCERCGGEIEDVDIHPTAVYCGVCRDATKGGDMIYGYHKAYISQWFTDHDLPVSIVPKTYIKRNPDFLSHTAQTPRGKARTLAIFLQRFDQYEQTAHRQYRRVGGGI